ncbi:GspH/FimT family pseudopilin [Alteromonas facilis]|uniref:GspH/FimT family pseudopilin n=1 Tax=Alteromonas facilis TaxID=2048004 RepID=UPI000C28AC87|nr:GspH/FimT family pseudopilin [Alteromonas facilis]
MNRQSGVTLVEMMISLAIVAILLTTVAPNVQGMLIQNRIVSEINELSGIIQFARHTAIEEQSDTVLCPTANFSSCTVNWSDPKMVFIDADGDGSRGANEEILVSSSAISDVNKLYGPNSELIFLASGGSNTAAELVFCHKNKKAKYARGLSLGLQGRVKSSKDKNKDGVYENASGKPLSCP